MVAVCGRYWHRFLFSPPGGVLRRYVLDRVGRVLVVTSGFLTLAMSWIGVVLISASSVLHWSSAVFVFVIVFNSLVTLWFLFGHETLVSSALRTFRHGASLSSVASLVVCVALLVVCVRVCGVHCVCVFVCACVCECVRVHCAPVCVRVHCAPVRVRVCARVHCAPVSVRVCTACECVRVHRAPTGAHARCLFLKWRHQSAPLP